MDQNIHLIIEIFPKKKALILELYNCDSDFRQLCNDYLLSIDALTNLGQDPENDKEIERDYKELCNELEKELQRILDHH